MKKKINIGIIGMGRFGMMHAGWINEHEELRLIAAVKKSRDGIEDIKNRLLRTPLDCQITFDDDPLRILRCGRFSITKDFRISDEIIDVIKEYDYEKKMMVVSSERIREELFKCFKYDTMKTILLLNKFPRLRDYIFIRTKLWLKPTFEA